MSIHTRGADLVCQALEQAGVSMVFGMPGTQSLALYEALRKSSLRSITATDELKAAFMAVGYHRASGRPAALSTIPGPGLTYALTGLAEALHDSAGLIWLSLRKEEALNRQFQFQVLNQISLVEPVTKYSISISDSGLLQEGIADACEKACSGEPGPVVVELLAHTLAEKTTAHTVAASQAPTRGRQLTAADYDQLSSRLKVAKRPLFLLGLGAMEAGSEIRALAEKIVCPIMTTCSGRGSIPEDHPLVVCPDLAMRDIRLVNDLTAESDLVLALGCKFTHNGSAGFRLKIPQEKLLHIDASAEVLNANYPASLTIQADLPALFRELMTRHDWQADFSSTWSPEEIAALRRNILATLPSTMADPPRFADLPDFTITNFFDTFRAALPRDAIVVTDSGFHQMLVRTFLPVYAPRGLITPSDFQSMGFGLPAAIGAALATPERRVVAVVGDGSMAMSAMELRTAVCEKIPLTVILLNDHSLGLIRRMQIQYFGSEHGVAMDDPDYAQLAGALGVKYLRAAEPLDQVLANALSGNGVSLVEVRLNDPAGYRMKVVRQQIKQAVRGALGQQLVNWLKHVLKR